MEDYITLSAKTLDDAITEALVQLGVTSDRLDYIVVEKGSEGFLGIGRKQAVIKARRKQEEKPVEEVVKEEPKVEEPVKEYSLGMKQRLGIGLALVGEPDLLVLDEPINGLDPQGIAEIRDMLLRLKEEQNMTILISSHILEELSKIATHYGIIHNGNLLQELTREELMIRCSERMEVLLDDPKKAIPVLDQMGFTNYQVMDQHKIYIYERLNESASVNMELAKAGILVRGIGITSEELENYFLNLTGGAQNA